ncbi:MAG: hypothetical protein GX601_13490 [Anaerolineales bacterium]|nr:hypothetical protein [Anaerolineales bacterium]
MIPLLAFLGGAALGVLTVWSISRAVARLKPTSTGSRLWILGSGLPRWVLTAGLLMLPWRHSALTGFLALGGFWVGRLATLLLLNWRWTAHAPDQAGGMDGD